MPIGRGATYVAAHLPAVPGNGAASNGLQADKEKIVLRPNAPPTKIFYSLAGWTGADRCPPDASGRELTTVPIPRDYIVGHNSSNSSATFLLADGRTLIQSQPFARCTADGPATSEAHLPPVDLYGPGIDGAHGGSRLSAIGGSLRLGELRRGGEPPRHALKLNVYAAQVLYKCRETNRSDCYRWPASTADKYAVGGYGTVNNGVVHNGVAITGGTPAMRMGALLAIPASQDLTSLGLVTEPAKQLAWTLQNYGAYIVDDTGGPGYALSVEDGIDGSFTARFAVDWTFEFAVAGSDKTSPWAKDIQRLMTALYVVDNNSRTTVGGGGEPLQPLAPPLPSLLPQR